MLNNKLSIIHVHSHNFHILTGNLVQGGWMLLEGNQHNNSPWITLCILCSLFMIYYYIPYLGWFELSCIHYVYIVLSYYIPKGKHQGGYFFTCTHGCILNQCKGYDTSSELRKDICFQNNIAMLQIFVTQVKKIKDFTYYIDNLNITFTFIGLSETWASEINHNLLEIPGKPMNNAFVRIRRKWAGQDYTYTILFNIKEGAI